MKAKQVGQQPLVLAFTGSVGVCERARESIEALKFQRTTFQRRDRVRKMIASGLKEHFDWVDQRVARSQQFQALNPPPTLAGLAAYFAEDEAQILEFESNEDSVFHDSFHAMGGGARTAYAVWRTLGGKRLRVLREGRAIHVALRVLKTAVGVDVGGVSEPFTVFIVDRNGARMLPQADVDGEMQAVEEWQSQQVEQLLGTDQA